MAVVTESVPGGGDRLLLERATHVVLNDVAGTLGLDSVRVEVMPVEDSWAAVIFILEDLPSWSAVTTHPGERTHRGFD